MFVVCMIMLWQNDVIRYHVSGCRQSTAKFFFITFCSTVRNPSIAILNLLNKYKFKKETTSLVCPDTCRTTRIEYPRIMWKTNRLIYFQTTYASFIKSYGKKWLEKSWKELHFLLHYEWSVIKETLGQFEIVFVFFVRFFWMAHVSLSFLSSKIM